MSTGQLWTEIASCAPRQQFGAILGLILSSVVFLDRTGANCAPHKIDPALIARSRPAIFGCFWPIFFFAEHNGLSARAVNGAARA